MIDHEIVSDAALQFRLALENIQEQFDDHLTAINENTNEIQTNIEFLSQLDSKIDKLAERIDKIQLFLQKNAQFEPDKAPRYDIKALTKQEKEVFMVLYTLEEKQGSLSYRDLARRLAVTDKTAQDYVSALMAKGIPVVKKYTRNTVYFALEPHFKAAQAKGNIVGLEQRQIQNWT